jgi:hypothetical protein
MKKNVTDETGNIFTIFETAFTTEEQYQKVYLDKNFITVKKEITQGKIKLLIEISKPSELIRRFPERAEFIVDRIRTLEATIL